VDLGRIRSDPLAADVVLESLDRHDGNLPLANPRGCRAPAHRRRALRRPQPPRAITSRRSGLAADRARPPGR
jgi:hypothetical protein